MFCEFETQTYGKWVLAGEHAVVRGHSAIAFPIKEKQLNLHYSPNPSCLKADFDGSVADELHLLFWSVLEHGQRLRSQSLNQLTGEFTLRSNIPIGVGLGASAALCVALSRWFAAQQLIASDEVFSFAKNLEHLFHGKSSGLDVAAVSSEAGIHFQQGHIKPVQQHWQPQWYLSSSEQVGITSHCITQVNKLWEEQPDFARSLDLCMQTAVEEAESALNNAEKQSALSNLQEAISKAEACFQAWGLIHGALALHMRQLKDKGALAVKPTGSGAGGYVLSLWDKQPPKLPFSMIEL